MKDYTISVVIPVYNTLSWMLEQCFNSVLKQSYAVGQMVVVDDGSTQPETSACLARYASLYPQQFELHVKEHGGIAETRNAGLEAVKGDYVCFLDSDDFWLEDFIEKLVCSITPDADIAFCGYRLVRFNGEDQGALYPPAEVLLDPLRFPYYTCGCGSRLYRTAHLRKYNCVFPVGCIMEDEAFSNLSIMTARQVVSANSYGYCVRQRDDSFARSRKSFNSQTVQSIPLEAFRHCLSLAPTVPLYRRNVLHYRILHGLMISSWVFCCFSPKAERMQMAGDLAVFLRKESVDTRRLLSTHRRLKEPFARLLALRLFIASVRLHLEKPMAALASLGVRLVYRIKGV